MSFVQTEKKPRKSRTLKLSNPGPNLSKKVLLNITSLATYNSDNPITQQKINLIKSNYETRLIKNFKTAKLDLDILTNGVHMSKKPLTNKVLSTITLLSTYTSDKPLNQHMIKLVQSMYKSKIITNFNLK